MKINVVVLTCSAATFALSSVNFSSPTLIVHAQRLLVFWSLPEKRPVYGDMIIDHKYCGLFHNSTIYRQF